MSILLLLHLLSPHSRHLTRLLDVIETNARRHIARQSHSWTQHWPTEPSIDQLGSSDLVSHPLVFPQCCLLVDTVNAIRCPWHLSLIQLEHRLLQRAVTHDQRCHARLPSHTPLTGVVTGTVHPPQSQLTAARSVRRQ